MSRYNKMGAANSAAIFDLIIRQKLDALFLDMPTEVVTDFLDRSTNDPDFGKSGNYSYYCKTCGKQWSFNKKDDKILFEKVHRISGCSFAWKENEKQFVKIKSERNINHTTEYIIRDIIKTKEAIDEVDEAIKNPAPSAELSFETTEVDDVQQNTNP